MSNTTSATVGRLAPSPTGRLHLGHARTFVLSWAHLRRRGARVVLRLEDLDGPRVRQEYCDGVLRDLEWLGLDWDGPVVRQSEHRDLFDAAIERLLTAGLAYPCVCQRGEIRSAWSAPHVGDAEPRYPGTCRGRFASVADAREKTGRDAALRFTVPDELVAVDDAVFGTHEENVSSTVGDFLVARRDGVPAYQLSVVVDDAASGVTEVHRGADLLSSTPRQALLQRVLGLPHPRWIHFPLVVDGDGRRLAKRADDLSLHELREQGVDPRAVVGWVARSAGLVRPPRLSPSDLATDFSLSELRAGEARVDAATLSELRSARR